MSELHYDVCIIGGGAAGLSTASGLVQLGLSVVLFEKSDMGGECLNHGCVPSKAFLSKASERTGSGMQDWGRVNAHIRGAISTIAPHDSQKRFEGLGVHVVRQHAQFTGVRQIRAADQDYRFRFAVLAVGGKSAMPDIPISDKASILTNENIFEIPELPSRLLILGGGAIGLEMATALTDVGVQVTLVSRGRVAGMMSDDSSTLMKGALEEKGVRVFEGQTLQSIQADCAFLDDGSPIPMDACLVAIGKHHDFSALGLVDAGIKWDAGGIHVGKSLQTSNKRVFAIGDCAALPRRSTHAAGYEAGLLVRKIGLRLPIKHKPELIPSVIYARPELAATGMGMQQAEKQPGIRILHEPFTGNDRAICEGNERGFIKLAIRRNGRVAGVEICGRGAADMLPVWQMMITYGMKLHRLAGVIHPYPTRGELSKKLAGSFYAPRLFSPVMRRIVRAIHAYF